MISAPKHHASSFFNQRLDLGLVRMTATAAA